MDAIDPHKIENLAKEVIEAARISLEPSASPDQRLCAHQFLEKIKDDLSIAVPCGFFLSGCDKEPPVRHMGLQILEDSIRFHWNDLPHAQKVFIKDNAMLLLRDGTLDILSEQMYIKDKVLKNFYHMLKYYQVSRLIVEMMKREWPQNWPELLEELLRIAVNGETQAELVLFIFLRMAEDVAVLQVVFSTLSCYLEWVSIHFIENHHHKFFSCMCKVISDKNLRQYAIESLLQIVSRKGKPEECKFIMSLFTEEAMQSLFLAANLSVTEPLQDSSYLFLKTLTQVVTTLGSQLCGLCIADQNVIEQKCFIIYLNALLSFTSHPSLTIYSYTNSLWLKLFTNDCIKKNQSLIDIIPSWIRIAYPKILKKGFNSTSDSSTCEYSKLDFDSNEEFQAFFYIVRAETCDTMKQVARIAPELVFTFIEGKMYEVFSVMSESKSDLDSLEIYWEALGNILEKVMTQLALEQSKYIIPKNRIKSLVQKCIEYQIDHYGILSWVLACISGLCCLLPLFSEMTEQILVKLFDVFNNGVAKECRTKSMREIRKHASCLLLKLCKNFPSIFFSSFDFLNQKIGALCEGDCISQGEKSSLIESLLILSNYGFDYQGQQDYIGKILGPWMNEWNGIRENITSTSSLIHFIGLNQPPNDDLEVSENFGVNRAKLFFGVDMIWAVLRRCTTPDNLAIARKGGFILKQIGDETITRNPAACHVLSMLPCIFCLSRSVNGLFQPEVALHFPKQYLHVCRMPEEEKLSFLGKRNKKIDDSTKGPSQKQQNFVRNMPEHLCHVISNCAITLGYEFFQYPHLSDCLIQSTFWNIHLLANFRIRFPCRLMKTLIDYCPIEFYESFLIPLVFHICPIMLNELQSRWAHAGNLDENEDDDDADKEEVVNNMCLYLLTRDYLEVLIALLKEKGGGAVKREKNGYQSMETKADGFEEVMETNDVDVKEQALHQGKVSHIGRLVIKIDSLCETVVMTLLKIISWPDSISRRRAAMPLMLCVQEMDSEHYPHLSEEMVKQIFTGVLYSIHIHGQHSADLYVLIDLAIALYEKLAHRYKECFRNILASIPNVRMDALHAFEDVLRKISDNSLKKPNKQNKQKRDAFRLIVENIIGKSLGEVLKKEVQLSDLRPLSLKARYKPGNLDETNENLNLCALFGASVAE
ncbi:Exportin-5 [Armadillidium nasatum]|uniref:Exportin-5 n=1 Tax=Armadillidium nasatum TaxID=96803 RepID=A0A5N5SQ55_9CRUS|nr:Exportin-5 [Armadillidium nasatum]